MSNQYLYFYNDGSGRTALGPKPPDNINYAQVWSQEHPRNDNGDLLLGMLMLSQGHVSSGGNFTPGYGLPPSGGPFESPAYTMYRAWQWGRSAPTLIAIPAVILLLLVATGGISAYSYGYILFYLFLCIPLLAVWGFFHSVQSQRKSHDAAVHQIRQEMMPTELITPIVESHSCPVCTYFSLHYYPETESAYCSQCNNEFPIAL